MTVTARGGGFRRAVRRCAPAAIFLAVGGPAVAQPTLSRVGAERPEPTGWRADSIAGEPGSTGRAHPIARGAPMGRDSSWWVPLTSAIIPGFGQARLGQRRVVAYLAIEAYGIIGYASGESAVRRERQRYLGLARDIARAFVPGNTGVGNWDYYEAMEKHIESGVFDRAPGSIAIQPEVDLETFNGALWLKARQLSDWPDPDVAPPASSEAYQAAISYYVARAVRPEFRWSWRNAQLEWDVYRQSIRQKNEASRDAANHLAVIALNHLLSTVDAFITLRLRGGVGAGGSGYRLSASLPFP